MKTGITPGKKTGKNMAADKVGKRSLPDDSILKYSNLIKEIPVEKQATKLTEKQKAAWKELLESERILWQEIFPNDEERVAISRGNLLEKDDPRVKIVKTLIWGYPKLGKVKNHIKSILKNLNHLCAVFTTLLGKGCELSQKDLNEFIISKIEKTSKNTKLDGIGESTWSKLLYFSNIKININGRFERCQIFDAKIVESLNDPQFIEFVEFNTKMQNENSAWEWKQDGRGKDKDYYFLYMTFLSDLSKRIKFEPNDQFKLEKLENFLFHYNLYFKFFD